MERRWGVQGFEWDARNAEHVARHGVVPSEAEEVFFGRVYVKRARRDRYAVYGRTGSGRLLMLVVVRRPAGVVRVITARDMIDRERRLFARRRK